MSLAPRWYCPPGVDLPAHARRLHPVGLLPGRGPDQAGGTCWGGAYVPDEPGWIKAPAGWWYHPGDAQPEHLIRGGMNPVLLHWKVITGAIPDQSWMVPVLLRPLAGSVPPIYVPAVDQVRQGGRWTIAPEIAGLCDRALITLHDICLAGETAELAEDRLLDYVGDILGLAYHVSRFELEAHGWLSKALVMRVLTTVVELDDVDAKP
jgi:hypothetical protein